MNYDPNEDFSGFFIDLELNPPCETPKKKLKAKWTIEANQDIAFADHLWAEPRFKWLHNVILTVLTFVWYRFNTTCFNCYCNWWIYQQFLKWPFHGNWAESELVKLMSEEISKEIDAMIVEEILSGKMEMPAKIPDGVDVLGFNASTIDGMSVYGCRGIGPSYDHFYNVWMKGRVLKYNQTDWPWHYFSFQNKRDEIDFFTEYKHQIDFDNDE